MIMTINVLHMYHDILDLYGDLGNMSALAYRSKARGISWSYHTAGIGEKVDFSSYDVVFMGGGADYEQQLVSKDLLRKKSAIADAVEEDTFFLLICGGYQLFGQYYIDAKGSQIEGLGIFDYYTEAPQGKSRCIGNILVEATMDDQVIPVIGFENHGGQTRGVKTPFAKVLKGYGNMSDISPGDVRWEGVYYRHVLGTYIHGPLLPKNPTLTDFIIKKSLHLDHPLNPLDDQLEKQAFDVMKRRLLTNG